MATVARADHDAYMAWIVHRYLKPGNILFAADATPRVSDYRLAKLVGAGEGVSVTGSVIGTPSYMAPEQAFGVSKGIDRLADVYALGAVLYACLSSRPQFKGATPLDTLNQIRTHDPAPVRALRPAAPRGRETVCLRCLAKDPRRRYAHAKFI